MLLIIHNAVLNDGEIKSATGAVQDCELHSSNKILALLACYPHNIHTTWKKNIFCNKHKVFE